MGLLICSCIDKRSLFAPSSSDTTYNTGTSHIALQLDQTHSVPMQRLSARQLYSSVGFPTLYAGGPSSSSSFSPRTKTDHSEGRSPDVHPWDRTRNSPRFPLVHGQTERPPTPRPDCHPAHRWPAAADGRPRRPRPAPSGQTSCPTLPSSRSCPLRWPSCPTSRRWP